MLLFFYIYSSLGKDKRVVNANDKKSQWEDKDEDVEKRPQTRLALDNNDDHNDTFDVLMTIMLDMMI